MTAFTYDRLISYADLEIPESTYAAWRTRLDLLTFHSLT